MPDLAFLSHLCMRELAVMRASKARHCTKG
jgi:hypothetical protein